MINWKKDYAEYDGEQDGWLGYIGKDILVAEINNRHEMCFLLSPLHVQTYSSLKAAKRGAERRLLAWLKDAGLEESHEQ